MTSTTFTNRHIGPNETEQAQMLKTLGYDTLDAFINAVVPANIRRKDFDLGAFGAGLSEEAALKHLRAQRVDQRLQPHAAHADPFAQRRAR